MASNNLSLSFSHSVIVMLFMSATENLRKLPEKKWKKTSYRVDIDRKTKPIENKCLN